MRWFEASHRLQWPPVLKMARVKPGNLELLIAESPRFVLSPEQAEALQRCTWTELEDSNVVFPFASFTIQFEPAAKVVDVQRGSSAIAGESATLLSVAVATMDEARRTFLAIERITSTGVSVNQLVAFCDMESGLCRLRQVRVGDAAGSAQVSRLVLSFLLMLNSRDCVASYEPKLPRQQQREAARKGVPTPPRIRVAIRPKSIDKSVAKASRGKHTHAKAHSVRGHRRRLPDGRWVKVDDYKRGGKQTSIPIYDATSLVVPESL
jgi:hypothetical protein